MNSITSSFNIMGVGTVAATKDTDTKEAMIYLPGFSPTAEGRVVATTQQTEKTGVNASGETVKSVALTSNTFPATWRSMGEPNRVTPPNVREGSPVVIYNVNGQNKYYWTTFGLAADTFRLETVMHGYSGNPNLDENSDFNIDDYYTVTVSTIEGYVGLRTSDSNNEATKFEVKVDGMNGKIMMGGKNKNFVVMDDIANSFTYTNPDETTFHAEKETVMIKCNDSVSIFAEQTISLMTTDFNLECNTISIKADTAEIHIGETNWIGNITQQGNYDQTGNYTQKGNYTQTGNMMQTGNITTSGLIRAGIDVVSLTSLNYHVHSGVQNGQGLTLTPVPMA